MAKIRYGKWGCWIPPVGVLLSLFALIITAQQPGFLSIRCGAKTNYTDENNITWVTDADYIDVGETADIGNFTVFGSSWHSLRFFPKPLNKSCYRLNVSSNVPYLLRVSFISGNYTGFQNYSGFQNFPSFAYSIETVDILAMNNLTTFYYEFYQDERILVTSGTMMYVCLIRTSDSVDPYISGIELRPLRAGMYAQAKPGTMLSVIQRMDVGGNGTMRYPQDKFDRIWTGGISIESSNVNSIRSVSTQEFISTSDTEDIPPSAVMQTALVVNSSTPMGFFLSEPFYKGSKSLLLLYFAEIEPLDMSASRSFYVAINGDPNYYNVSELTLSRNYPIRELQFLSSSFSNFSLWNASNSTLPPIINACELYSFIHTQPPTSSQDIDALDAIKKSFDIKSWISDPCYLISWNGINCYNSSSGIRISEIDLSGRNLTGSVPNDIANLTALVNVSLDNNHLSGSLPNLSSLTLLERLYLQNNSLNGIVPEWLSELKKLKELNIENNNFSGVIPAQLLLDRSLKLSYSGNPYLCRSKRECAARNSKYKKLKVLLGLMFSGILISALALIAGIIMYRHKKNKCVTTESNGVQNGPENGVDIASIELTDSTVMVPINLTESRAFTLEDMMAATQKFTGNIGKGGFGSVFFGKLPEGREVAVKVLSLFNEQGIHQFLNEIDVLSKLHHKNLVSLLGHCNESRELMIIYEHMSGGSFKDRLYGPSAESSELNWKRRLKIALDAAQGLEYMHIVCTPKIIHRDIKTANILLDSNFNGKLGDFGLSRVWINGEASHVTTMVKGTAGYLDPEYFSTERLTDKSDVYSFGVVLLEIICGRPPIDAKLSVDKLNIIRWATPFVEMDAIPGQIEEIIDRRLGGNYNLESVTRVAKIAIRCVKAEPFYRPSVSEVVEELREAMKLEEICTRPAQSIS